MGDLRTGVRRGQESAAACDSCSNTKVQRTFHAEKLLVLALGILSDEGGIGSTRMQRLVVGGRRRAAGARQQCGTCLHQVESRALFVDNGLLIGGSLLKRGLYRALDRHRRRSGFHARCR